MRLDNLSIRQKLYMLSGSAAAVALLFASIAFSYQHITSFRQNSVGRLHSVAEILAANTIAAITFDDQEAASEVLGSLKRNEFVVAAYILSSDGRVLASYSRDDDENFDLHVQPPTLGYHFDSTGALEMFTEISDGDEVHGVLYIKASMEGLNQSLKRYAVMVGVVFVVSLITALLFSSRLQRLIATPIKVLAGTAAKISKNHDYSIRVRRHTSDEIGTLYDAFNQMLEQIETGEKELIEARTELEQRVVERTSQLSDSNDKLVQEMKEKENMQRRLIEASRQAGMAEVATGVLHNVGNVLNSVNISANLVRQKIRSSRLESLIKLSAVVSEHQDDLSSFVSSERGSHLPKMLEQLGVCLNGEREWISKEVESLQANIDHIKKIVAAQQSHSSMLGVTESLKLSEVIHDAVNIGGGSLQNHNIEIEKDFKVEQEIVADRHQLMQILVNLIRNAGQAIKATDYTEGKIVLRTRISQDDFIVIQVVDNGIGIAPESIKKIFIHGFTTKKDGHGFGLHSSALVAKEMGGSLSVESEGPNFGATFSLRLPINALVITESHQSSIGAPILPLPTTQNPNHV